MAGVHLTMVVFALGAVVAAPFVVLALARWTAQGAATDRVPIARWLVPVVAILSGAAGVIHLLVIEEHLEGSTLHAGSFAALAAFQSLWAVAYPARPSWWSAWAAVAVNLGAAAVWAWSRTTGLPGWLDGGDVEAVGLADVVSTVFELGVVAGLLAVWWRPVADRLVRGRGLRRGDAALGMAMVVLGVSLLTLGAIAEIAAGAQVHVHGGHDAGVASRR